KTCALPICAWLLTHLERLDDIALGDVPVTEADTALEALADLGDVVLLPPQRGDGQVVGHHHVVAQQACLAVATDDARAHDRAGDVAELGGTEHLADLRSTELDLFELGLEHALESTLDVVDGGVGPRGVLDPDAFAIGD